MGQMNNLELIDPSCLNFKWYEVWKSSTADRLQLDNVSDDPEIIENVRAVTINLLQPLRDDIGSISPQSWVRLEPLEKALTYDSYLVKCQKRGWTVKEFAVRINVEEMWNLSLLKYPQHPERRQRPYPFVA